MRALLQLVRFKRDDWVVPTFVGLVIRLLRRLAIKRLVVGLELAALLSLEPLLHSDHRFLTQGLRRVFLREELSFLRLEVLRNKVVRGFH